MWRCWMPLILTWVSMATPTLCQSGDWGSGFDMYSMLQYEPQPDKCSVYFSTNAASARRLKAQKEELAFLQAIQHGNKAVMENLVQFVGAELGDQSYEDVIKENIIGIQEDQKSCHEVVEKAEEDLEKQLEGEVSGALAGMQKIREESMAFEDMLHAATDIANRLEISSQALHASFTKQLSIQTVNVQDQNT